jgi:hypothetical protein
MAQKIIRTFRLFINEDTAVHDLVRTISGCIKNSGADYAQKSADFFSIMSSKVVQFKQAQEHSFNSMSRQDQNLRIFAIVEMYCRTLQDDLRQAFNVTGQSLSITSAQPQQPTYPGGSALKTYHPSTSYNSPTYRSRPPPQFKRLNVHSLSSSLSSSSIDSPPTGQQSHSNHISERVETCMNDLQILAQAKVLRDVIYDQTDPLPDGACLAIADGATEPTIHIQLAAVHDVEATATLKEFIDTKFTVDKEPYSGNCTLCGE